MRLSISVKKGEGELSKISDWFAHNRLTLNYSKTEFLEFSKPANVYIISEQDKAKD